MIPPDSTPQVAGARAGPTLPQQAQIDSYMDPGLSAVVNTSRAPKEQESNTDGHMRVGGRSTHCSTHT